MTSLCDSHLGRCSTKAGSLTMGHDSLVKENIYHVNYISTLRFHNYFKLL